MTSQRGGRKGKAGSGAGSGKLRVKKETLKDLDVTAPRSGVCLFVHWTALPRYMHLHYMSRLPDGALTTSESMAIS